MTSAVAEYRELRAAQDDRFNNRPGAGCVDTTRTDAAEFVEYFSEQEERVTFRQVLESRRRERESAERYLESVADEPAESDPAGRNFASGGASGWFSAASCFYLLNDDLRVLAESGDGNARAELERRKAKRAAKRALRGAR